MENKEIVKLALDTMHNSVSGNFSAKEGSEALRQAFIEMNGGSDKLTMKSFRDHPQLFQLIEEVMPIMIQEGLRGDELAFNMVDYRNLAEGDQNRFWTEDNSDLIVAKIADGSTSIRRQRLNVGQAVSIDTELHAIKVYEELNRLLAGRVDFNTLVDRLTRSYTRDMRNQILAAFEGVTATTTGLNATYVKTGTFSAPTLRELIDHVEASTGEKATILGTKAGLGKIVDSDANAVALTAASAKEDLYNLGYFGKFYATPMVSMRQVHKPGTDAFAINDNKIYVMAGNDKPIKFVREGEGLMVATDAFSNADLTQEYLYGEKYGIGVIFNQKMGIYTLA